MADTPRFVNISLEHPGVMERRLGAKPTVQLAIDRDLKSGRLDFVPLERGEWVLRDDRKESR